MERRSDYLQSSLCEAFAATLGQRVVARDEDVSILDVDGVSSLGAYCPTL